MLAGITNANEQRPTSAGKPSKASSAAAKNASWTRVSNPHQAWLTIIGTVAVLVIIVLCLGFFCELGIGRPVRDHSGSGCDFSGHPRQAP